MEQDPGTRTPNRRPHVGAPCLGIVGGVGPYAGIDLHRKILSQTAAREDGEHLPVLHFSCPAQVPDRTAFLLGESAVNPARALASQVLRLERAGAVVAGIPCNTAHAAPIFDELRRRLDAAGSRIRLLPMIAETVAALKAPQAALHPVGLLATLGTHASGAYEQVFHEAGLELLTPDDAVRRAVHEAIYSPSYGVKARGPNEKAAAVFREAIEHLAGKGAQAVIMGCSEIPAALSGSPPGPVALVDPTLLLARAMIRAFRPGKLVPLEEVG